MGHLPYISLMRILLLSLLMFFSLPLLCHSQTKRVEFAKDTIMGEKTKEYDVPLSGAITINMVPTKTVRPMGIRIEYLRSDDGKDWKKFKIEELEVGALEKAYKTKVDCKKCKVRVMVKQLSLFEFKFIAVKEVP